jgi:predicted secreted protein
MRTLVRALALLSSVAVVSVTVLGPASAADPTVVVTQLPAQVRLIPGETVVLSLSTNRTTGYTWSTRVRGDRSAISVSKGAYQAPASANGMVGVPGTTVWSITAEKVGTARVNVVTTSPGGERGSDGVLTIIVMKG